MNKGFLRNTVRTIFISLLFAGCSGTVTAPVQSDYFIFGTYFGFCIGEQCIETYMIRNGKLYEDTRDIYPGVGGLPVPTSFETRPDSLFQKVKSLPQSFPPALLNEQATTIGMPDAGDWGGYYVEILVENQVRYWRIDRMKSNLPAYLHQFTDELESAFAVLN